MLTPVDIQQKKFNIGLGYDKKDVNTFFQSVSESYEQLYRLNAELKEKVETLTDGLQHYKSKEEALEKSLMRAEKDSEDTKSRANKEAKNIEIIPYFDEDYNPMHEYFYNVNITNFSKNVYIVDSNNNRFEYEGSYNNDSVFGVYKPGDRITFKIYGAYDGDCSDQLLVTLKVDFDYYNDYSKFCTVK
mgnify:CR=1 FL=1